MGKKSLIPAVRFHTLGCKVNFCDTNALAATLIKCGFTRAGSDEPADIEIVNTCAVTARSIRKARQTVSRIRARNPRAFIVATGCALRMSRSARGLERLADAIEPSLEGVAAFVCETLGLRAPRALTPGLDPSRTRAFVKIQDGCDALCAYCVVPFVRGRPRSVPQRQVLVQVRKAADHGRREIVLCGTHLGRYGKDMEKTSLATLITEIGRLDARFRIRLSSVEPLEVSDELLEVMGSSKKVCPHLHIPLQSGSDRILEAMRRPYGAALFLSTLSRVRATLSDPAITTDIMAGFPGETEEDHHLTIELARRARFARAHVFVFSPRPATAAEGLNGRVASETARRRAAEIREVCGASATKFRDGLVGRTVEVLGEVVADGRVQGFCRRYQRVRFQGNGQLVGRLTRICIMIQGPDGVLEGRTAPQERIP